MDNGFKCCTTHELQLPFLKGKGTFRMLCPCNGYWMHLKIELKWINLNCWMQFSGFNAVEYLAIQPAVSDTPNRILNSVIRWFLPKCLLGVVIEFSPEVFMYNIQGCIFGILSKNQIFSNAVANLKSFKWDSFMSIQALEVLQLSVTQHYQCKKWTRLLNLEPWMTKITPPTSLLFKCAFNNCFQPSMNEWVMYTPHYTWNVIPNKATHSLSCF